MILHMDNFSIYGTTVGFMDDGIYAQANGSLSLVNDPDGISGGRVARCTSSAASRGIFRFALPTTKTAVGVALRIWCSPLPTGTQDYPTIASFRNGSNNDLATVQIDSTGRLIFYDGVNTITSDAPAITANAWWHLEVLYDRAGVGSIEVRAEGITVLQDTDLGYSSATPIYQVATIGGLSNFTGSLTYYKDYVIWDTTGSHNNTFLGSVLVTDLVPVSDVALNWTPSTGSNGYSILDNIPPVDTTYIEAPTPAPSPYVCELSNLPDDVTSVRGLMTVVRATKTDGGDGSLQNSIISNGDTGNGANRPITVAMTYWRDIFETDPDTGSAWLPAAVDAAQLQINRTA